VNLAGFQIKSPLIALLAILLSTGPAMMPAGSALEDGRIGVLYIGCVARSRPFWMMRSDPMFQITFVQATIRDFMAYGPMPAMTESDVHRMVRLYMPRNLDDLSNNYDVTVLFEANVHAVSPHIDKLARGTSERGLGTAMCGGWQSFGGAAGYSPWGETSVGKLLPTEDVIGIWDESDMQRLVIDEPGNELMSSIPWDPRDPALSGPIWHHNRVSLKQGATQLAHVVTGSGRKDPLMVTWRLPSDTRTFALTSESCRLVEIFGMRWEYAYDYASNLMIYLDDRPVPQDIALVHAARDEIFKTATRRSLLLALLEFCESFGANVNPITDKIDQVDAAAGEAVPQYLDLRFEDVLDTYDTVDELLESAELEAVKLKNRTLLWVYIIEWLAVTGTSMACGFILWSLMVRRRLYREVGTTALLRRDESP
jgi:uncharacterized membrane protein